MELTVDILVAVQFLRPYLYELTTASPRVGTLEGREGELRCDGSSSVQPSSPSPELQTKQRHSCLGSDDIDSVYLHGRKSVFRFQAVTGRYDEEVE